MPPRLIAAIAQLLRDLAPDPVLVDAVIAGKHAGEFPVDVFQDRDGAATVVNVCEVLGVPVAKVNPREVMTRAIRLSVKEAGLPDGTFTEMSAALKARAERLPENCRQVRRWIEGADLTIRQCEQDGDLPVLGALLVESVSLLTAAQRSGLKLPKP